MAQDKLSTLFSTLNSQGIYNDMSVDEFRAKMADSEKRATVYNGMRKWNIPGVADTFEAFSADLGFAGADTGTGIAEQNARQLDALTEQYDGDREYAQQMQIRQNLSTSLDDMTARVQEAMRNITTPTRINSMFGFANNPERNELAALQSLIGNLQKEIALPTKAEKEHGDKRSGLVAGLKTADLTSILTAGWSDAANQLRQSAALRKATKGEPLSPTDQMYVDLYELMQEAEANTQALGGTTSGANIGRGVAGSIPYMTGMIATSGVSGAARAYVSNAVKAIAPTGVKNFIDGAAKAAVGKAIGKKAITKGASTVGGAAVGALAALPFQSGMYSNFAQKTLEQYDVDAGVARLARPTSTFKRLYQSSAEAFTDIFTEQMGGLLTKSARFLGRELGSKASLFNKLGRFNSGRISQLAFFGGPIEEFEEELWAGFLSPLLSAKSAEERTESWRQMFSAQSLWETAMTTALMSGGFSVLDAADNEPATLRSRSLAKKSLSSIKDAGLRQTLYDGLHNKELETGVKDIASYDWSNASSGDMANAIDYVRFELNYQVRRGYATAQQSENEYLKRVVAAGESIYYGKDGNTPSSDIIIATTANGVYNVLAGDIDSTDPKATVIVRDAEGRRTQIANKDIQSAMTMPVSDYLSQAYAEIYGQVEQSVTPTQLQEDIADAQEAGVDPSAAISSQMDEAIEGSQFTLPDGRRGEVAALRPDGTVEINVLSSDGSVPIDNLEMGLQDVVPLIQAEDETEAEAQKIATEISSLPESEQENATEPTVETTEQEITPTEPTVPETETPVTTEPQVESTVEPTVAEQTEVETAKIESEPAPELNVQPASAEVDYSTMPAEKFAEAMLDINDSSEEAVQMVDDMRQANNKKLQAALSEYEAHKQNNKPTSPNELANYAAKRKELKATIEALQAEDKRLSDTLAALGGATTQEAETPQQAIDTQADKSEGKNHLSHKESEIKPIGKSEFGPIYDQFKRQPEKAIEFILNKKDGEAVGALYHPEIGDISIVYGNNKAGLAKIERKHPEVLKDLQTILNTMKLQKESDNRVKLESETHFAVVSKEYNGVPRDKWLLTAYEKKSSAPNNTMDTVETTDGKQNDTATPQNTAISNDKDRTSEPISKETTEKSTDVPEQPTSEEPTTAPEPVVEPATEVVEEPQTETEAEPEPEAVSASPYAEQSKSKEEQLAEEVKARILKEGTDFDKDFDLIAPKDVALNKDISNNVDTIISKLAEKQANGEELGSYGGFVKVEGYDGNAYHQVKDYLVQLKKGVGELVQKWLQDNNMNDTDGLHAYVIERYEEAYNDAVKAKEEQKSDTVSQANSVEEMYDKMLAAHGPITPAPLKRTFDLWAYTSDDKLRPGMTGIYHNADRQEAVATDANILVASKTDYDKQFAGKVIGVNDKEIPNAVFPNYTALNTDDKVSIDINVENLKGILGGIKKEQKELWAKEKAEGKKPGAFKNFLSDTVVYIKLGNGKVSAFKFSLFEDFVVAMEHIGADKIYGSDPIRAIFAKSDKGLAMAMPRNNTLVDMERRDENLPGRDYYIDVSANASKAPEAPKKEETKKSKASKTDKPKATKPNKVSDHVATRKAAATARKEAQQNLTYKYTPIGTGYFGDIYNQFKGRFNDAFDLLVENQGGEATAVFNRPEIGDIDLVWGDKKGGLAHIIDKHTGKDKSFSNNSEAKTVISDIINNGTVVFQDGDKVVIKSGHKQVTLRRNIREKGKKIADKNWLLTAYDETKADSTSAISATNQGRAAQPTNVTRGKNSKETDKNKTQLQDFGEKIEGARKDVYKTLAKAFDDATLQSLIELPFSKSFKRPDLAKLVESGVLREEDALYAEAFMTVYLSTAKPKPTKSDERLARIYGRPTKVTLWAEEAYKRIQQLQEFMLADNAKRDEIIASFAKPEAEQAAREEREYQERIGGRGPLRSPEPVGVIAEVLNRIGYSAGDTVKIDCPLVRVNSTFSRYELRLPDGSRNYQVPTAADLEEAITNLVMIAKMRRGDNDVQYHKEQFAVRGDTPIKKGNGKFVVGYIKKNGGIDYKRFSSEAEAKEFAAKQTGDTVMREEQEVVGYEAYKVRFQKPLDGDLFILSKSYPTREAALEAIENNLAELSAEANTFVAAKTDYEKNKKKAQDDLQIKLLIDRDTRKPQYFVSTKRGEQVSGYFDSSAEARKYLAENKEAIQKRMEELKEARSKFAYFSSQGEPRVGEDYRKGVDATPEMFQDMFGFRGVQFGNWTNARDRQEALNQAYDGFMDLASVLGVSPRALSLAGELGLAFGARGGGSAAAHYELKDVVINLTKTKGAGSLAHEWWHALDNYFARQAGISQGMATKAKQLPGVRPEVKKAFDDIVKTVNNTFYAKRSKAKGDYWGSEIELTARLFGEWVVYELAKTGRSNHFLSRGITPETFEDFKRMNYAFYEWARRDKNITIMPYEEFANTPSALEDMPYPTKEETEQMGVKVRELFDILQEREEGDRTILFRDAEVEYTEEEEAIIDKAIADGTYLKAPNGQPTNLTPKQWAQVRTKAFKKWFGDWEKAARIEKLRGQLPVEISGSEVPFNEDIALYRKNAEQYAKELRGTYTNRDTGNVIDLTRSGITELKQHDATSVAHLQSFAAIPQLIEQSIYITTLPNEDVKVKADSFDYYVSGLRIGGEDYTAKIVVANIGGKRYYDHKLSAIEKGSLLDLIRIPNLNQEQQTAISEFKDKRLVSILQTNSSKIVDANGEPKVVEHSTWNEDFNTFDIERLGESSGDEGLYGAGFYFGNVGHTALYGDRSIQAYLNMERPLVLPEDNIMRSFDYLVENFDKQGLRDIIVKGGGKSQSATMGEIIDIIKDVQARHSTGEYDELIEQMSQYWYPADDRVIEQTIFKKVGFAFYRALTPFIENNIGRREFTEALSKAGYDGVVYDNTEWVVYKPDQIKSATDNVGTFDSTNDDIRYREDRNGQPIGDGSVHFPYEVVDFSGYPQISHQVSKSAGTESVYVTYTNEDTGAKATVRFSGHENNATKFGDQLRGWYSNSPIKQQMENELKYRLGLVDKKNIYAKYIPTSQVSNKALAAGTHPEADKTIQELYELPVGTDLAQYKGKLAKGSRYLITGDKVEEDRNRVASVVYIPKVEPKEAITSRIIAEAQKLAATHNVPIEIHETREEITDSNSSIQRRKRASFGWFDPAEGKVHLVLPSHDSVEELQNTFYHEAVAHYGLPKLLGEEQFTALCGNVWKSLPAITQKRLIRKYPNADVNTMAEEYMATIAEGNITPGLFQRIIAFVREAFRKMGVNLRISDNDIAYLLWRSKNNLQRARTASQKATVIAADKRMRKALSLDRERVRARSQYTEEEAAIIDKAIADGTYLKAPNGQPTNLTPKQWAQVRTKAFKEWFGNWEKAARIKKLRASSPIDVEFSGQYELTRNSAKKWLKDNLKGEYLNSDTDEHIVISNVGINEVTSHGSQSIEHLKSLVAIPQMIENSIFIDELPNSKDHDKYDSYRYYVCGLKIDGIDYTAKIVVGVKGDSKYYDHRLTEIEKGNLIDNLNGLSNSVAANQSSLVSVSKDTKLNELLQTNSSKIVDANGEPRIMYHGSNWRPLDETPGDAKFEMQDGALGNGAYFTSAFPEAADYAREKLGDSQLSEDEIDDDGYVTEVYLNVRDANDIISSRYGINEIIVKTISPNQVKSATDNVGTFDSTNDDIRFRDAEEPGADIAKEVTEELSKEDVPTESMARIAKRRILDKYGKKYPHLQTLYETDNAIDDKRRRGRLGRRTFTEEQAREYDERYGITKKPEQTEAAPLPPSDTDTVGVPTKELSIREKINLAIFDAKAQVKQFQEVLAAEGINITSAMDYYSAENRTSSIAEVEKKRFQRNFANPLKNQINELAAAFDESGADPYYIVSTYALAEHSIERHNSGLTALSSDEGSNQWNLENTSTIVRRFREDIAEYTIEKYTKHGKDAFSEEELRTLSPATRAKVEQGVEVDSLTDSEKMEIGEVKIEVLWRLINRLNDETLNIAQRAGLKSREEIALIKSHNWKYYVPLRNVDLEFENLTDPMEMFNQTFAQRRRSSTVFSPEAEGRTTKAADPFGQMIRTGQQFILVAETNKAKQRLLNLLIKARAVLPYSTTSKYFEVGTRYLQKVYNEATGKFVWKEVSDIDGVPPYEEIEKSKWAREKIREHKSAMIQAAQEQDWDARSYHYQKMKEYEAEETVRTEVIDMDFNDEARISLAADQTRIVEVWVNGRKHLIKFKDQSIALAVNGLVSADAKVNGISDFFDKTAGTATRWLAKVRTQLSPDFIVTNALRDFRHALRMHYLDAENGHLKGFVNNYNTKTAQAINRGIRGKASPLTINELRGYRLSNPAHIRELATLYGEDRVMDTLFDLFQSYGGQTGFAFAEDTKTIERDIRREYAREKAMRSERPVVRAWGKSREAASVVSEAFKMGGEVVENMSRFATFLANIEAGRTAEEAAQAAKEITVNFNRRGQYTKTLGSLYTFFNATMQAMAQVYRVGKENPKRLAALAIYEVAKGFAMAMLAELFKGDDDKEVPAYTLKENLVIPLPGGKYLKFPEPQTFSVFHGIGVDLAQAALGKISNAEVANNLIHSVLEASLYGYTEGGTDMALEVFIPSIVEPFVDVARNKNAFGSQIHPEDNWGLTPDSELGNRNTNELIYLICKSLNQLGGGNEVRPAGMTDDGDIIQFINLLDVNPANVEYIINQFAGGSIYGGKFAQQLWRLAASLVSDSEATLKDVPMLNRILGTLDTATPNSAYYREKERIENAYSVMNKENKAGIDVDPIQLEYHTRRRNYIKYIQKQIDAVREVQYSHKVNSEAYNAYKEIVEDYMRLCVKALNNADWTSGAERKREQYINSLYKEYGIESKLQTLNEKYGN